MKMKWILTIGTMLTMASCVSVRPPETAERHSHADVASVKKTFDAIIIPDVNLRQITADCAITFWIGEVQRNDPQHRGVSTIFHGGTKTPIEVVARNMSALALLNDICRQADLGWWLTPTCLMIAPRNEEGAEQRAAPLPSAPWTGPSEGAR
jgi:hypothetical protein